MNTKMLSIRSFERNQNLLNLINRIITHLQLKTHGIANDLSEEQLNNAKQTLSRFLQSINNAIAESQGTKILKGVDFRERSFIRKFMDAKRKPKQYQSILFKKSPMEVIDLLNTNKADNSKLIEALTDLRNLINEHIALDLKDLVGDI